MSRCKECGRELPKVTMAQRKFKKGDYVKLSPLWFRKNGTLLIDEYTRSARYRVVGFCLEPEIVRIIGGPPKTRKKRHSFHISFLSLDK